MNKNIKYTQPLLIRGQKIRTAEHVVECSDTETFANGHPKPIGDSLNWSKTIEAMDGNGVLELPNGAKYEILS